MTPARSIKTSRELVSVMALEDLASLQFDCGSIHTHFFSHAELRELATAIDEVLACHQRMLEAA